MKIRFVTFVTVLALAFCIGVTQQTAIAQSNTNLVFGASAFGTDAFVGTKVLSGKSAFVTLGDCSTTIGAHVTNTVTSANVPPIFTTGAINTVAMTSATMSQASSHVQQANALAGLITADDVTAVSTTMDQNGSLQVSASGSAFTNLVVAGQQIQGTPPPNTKIQLPGFGFVVLNEEHSKIGNSSAKLVVNMIHVFVTQANVLNIPKGAQIIVADALSRLQVAPNAALDGFSFGSSAHLGHTIISGRSALEIMPCLGTDGELRENTAAGVNVPKILTTGSVKDTVQGTVSSDSSVGETTSTVHGSNLVSKLLTAKVIKADSNASTTDGIKFTFSDTGSRFLGLKVSGHPGIHDNVPPNTKVKISGLGTLWLHRVIQTDNYIEVRMVELIVNQANKYGIAVGTEVRIADAHVSLHTNKQ
ncbi:MAG TPA: choice-of-anchor P family protein [Terriglobales bacterium]|nr:choice-of-anchor P family protein [Terriglobales bacterium]